MVHPCLAGQEDLAHDSVDAGADVMPLDHLPRPRQDVSIITTKLKTLTKIKTPFI